MRILTSFVTSQETTDRDQKRLCVTMLNTRAPRLE